jgi:hypothetical protein
MNSGEKKPEQPKYIKFEEIKLNSKKIRIVCISDTHEHLEKLIQTTGIPDGDILIHCGGFNHFFYSTFRFFK